MLEEIFVKYFVLVERMPSGPNMKIYTETLNIMIELDY